MEVTLYIFTGPFAGITLLTKTFFVLGLAYLGDEAQIETILFVLYRPRKPRLVAVAGIFTTKL
jgi:hypothetical protein